MPSLLPAVKVSLKLLLRSYFFNPLNAELHPIRHLLALVGARHIVYVSRVRVKRAQGQFVVNSVDKRIRLKAGPTYSLFPWE
jgi:hypothetical protein